MILTLKYVINKMQDILNRPVTSYEALHIMDEWEQSNLWEWDIDKIICAHYKIPCDGVYFDED